jgi:glycosyltransferase involved in cell wall biosynthesis
MSRPHKILFAITKSNWGGAQRYVFDLATTLPKDRFEVVVALGGTGERGADAGRLSLELARAGINTRFVGAFMRDISITKEYAALKELVALFKQEQPDTVHLNSSKAGGLGALAARIAGVPHIIFTSHGLPWDEDRNPLSRALIGLSTWITFMLCHRVIVISKDNFARASRLPFCGKKVQLIYNGLKPLQFVPRDEARAFLKLPPNAFVIGALGEMTWNKNYQTFLRALSLLVESKKDFKACIIGDGEERAFIETLIDEEGLREHVTLAGFVPEGYRYLKAYDVFVLPSLKEGLPYVLLEAGQAGLPVVASNISGSEDIIGNKVSGLLFTSKDSHNLATQLKLLFGDANMRARLGTNLQERVQKEFSLDKMLAETIVLY